MCSITKPKDRLCCVCDSHLHGRSDKIFCNYRCKNKYHSTLRRHTKSLAAQTINKLNRNHEILTLYQGTDTEKFSVNRLELMRQGFHFEIISGIESNKYGFKFQVYEFSWYLDKNQTIMVYRDKKHSETIPFVYNRWERSIKNLQTQVIKPLNQSIP